MVVKVADLTEVLNAINLLYLRNKNQHRVTKWWKWFSVLKRCMTKLIQELTYALTTRFHARLNHLRDRLIPRCYLYALRKLPMQSIVQLTAILGLLDKSWPIPSLLPSDSSSYLHSPDCIRSLASPRVQMGDPVSHLSTAWLVPPMKPP